MPEANYCFTSQNDPYYHGNCILWGDQDNEVGFPFIYPMNSSWEYEPKAIETKFYHHFTETALANQEIDWSPDVTVSESQEAIIQEALLTSSEDKIQDLFFKIKTSNVILNKVEIANRLLLLHNFSKEEEPDSISISVESLRNFYSFLLKNIKHKINAADHFIVSR